jgi:hypothetical protein
MQVEEHFWEAYMGIHGFCLPKTTFGIEEAVPTESLVRLSGIEGPECYDATGCFFETPVTDGYSRGEEVTRDKGTNAARKQEIKDKNATLPGSDLAGFLPLRQDFDVEHENDAELLLADMEFLPDEHPSERELKLQVIRIYNSKLKERDERKKFVIERGLVDRKEQQAVRDRIIFIIFIIF